MKDRRPRKLKKVLKRRFEKVQAMRTIQTAFVTLGSAMQMAAISSRPIPKFGDAIVSPATKSLACAQLAMETAQKISEIMNTGPKNWREA